LIGSKVHRPQILDKALFPKNRKKQKKQGKGRQNTVKIAKKLCRSSRAESPSYILVKSFTSAEICIFVYEGRNESREQATTAAAIAKRISTEACNKANRLASKMVFP